MQINKLKYQWRSFLLIAVYITLSIVFSGCGTSRMIKDFTSDGCSLFPDGSWCECCFEHDISYWYGGTPEDRKEADRALRQCVKEKTGSGILAWMMYRGVRAGGHPVFPTWYRWGYGWDYGRMYQTLTEEEFKAAEEKLIQYFLQHPETFCEK
ncbi:MAG: hypothetical protein SWH61_11880 [Thermodesulfobacteriota bacterium]|nr:hypothetical protein [Thermodesulfobacteriota bacterium]